jgi:hypothetical protein
MPWLALGVRAMKVAMGCAKERVEMGTGMEFGMTMLSRVSALKGV